MVSERLGVHSETHSPDDILIKAITFGELHAAKSLYTKFTPRSILPPNREEKIALALAESFGANKTDQFILKRVRGFQFRILRKSFRVLHAKKGFDCIVDALAERTNIAALLRMADADAKVALARLLPDADENDTVVHNVLLRLRKLLSYRNNSSIQEE